jgi:triacylglycerol lipase
MRRVKGLKSLIHDTVDRVVDLVEVGQESTSRSVMRVLAVSPPLAEAAQGVNSVRRVFTRGVHATIKGVNRAVERVSDAGIDAAYGDDATPEAPLPLRSDVIGTAAWVADALIGATNGVVGDHLERRGNGLDLGMALRGIDGWLAPGAAPADAGPRVVVLVHGLATTEWSWCIDAALHHGDPAANFGTRLQADLGYTPIYARYNTGRHISENGRALAARLRDLLDHWPVPVEELLLVGHSMGGLVIRSACHIAAETGMPWVDRVQRIVTLASPLQGAPLERFGNIAAAVLSAVDLPGTLIPASLINGRSAGIKDLRYGYVQDAEWEGSDPDAVAEDGRREIGLPPHIAWCFISATVGAAPDGAVSQVLGDLLVRIDSASGPQTAPSRATTRHVGGLHHAAIQVHPTVYDIIHAWLSGEALAAPSGVDAADPG